MPKPVNTPPQCQLRSMGCQGHCVTERELEFELCQQCLEVRDARLMGASGPAWHFGYTNYRGEFSERRATPIRFEFTSTEHHPEEQWIMYAVDHDKGMRAFAMADMVLGNKPILPEVLGDMIEVEKRFPGISDEASLRIAMLEVMLANMVVDKAVVKPDEQQQKAYFSEWDKHVRVRKGFGQTLNMVTERQNAYLAGLQQGLELRTPDL